MKDKKEKKPKKDKPVYIDDGRTIADMSGLRGEKPKKESGGQNAPRFQPPIEDTWKSRMTTYFAAVRMMFVPMLITMGIIALAFLVLRLIGLAYA